MERSEGSICEPCEKNGDEDQKATKKCLDCEENYCDRCSEFHVALKMNRFHRLWDMSSNDSIKAAVDGHDQCSDADADRYNSCFIHLTPG